MRILQQEVSSGLKTQNKILWGQQVLCVNR